LDDTTDLARLIADSAAALVPPDGDLARVRACRFTPPGFDPEAYRRTADLGWLLLAVDEANGGLALGLGPWCALSRQLGRGLVPEPLTGAILACRLAQGFLPDDLRTGRSVIATAWQGATRRSLPRSPRSTLATATQPAQYAGSSALRIASFWMYRAPDPASSSFQKTGSRDGRLRSTMSKSRCFEPITTCELYPSGSGPRRSSFGTNRRS
jgi:hypothetical protein